MKTDAFYRNVIRESGLAWFSTHGKIWAKDRALGLVTPKANRLQAIIQQVIDKFEDLGLPCRVIGLKPRARGSTTFFTAQGYTAMRRRSTSAVFIGGQSDQTVGLWNMMKTYHKNDAFDWGNTGEVNEKGATFTNGSRAKKETAKDVQAGIGDTYQLLHATEAARWAQYGVANAADVMANILKAVPLLPNTMIFLESTAEGVGNDFHSRWLGAIDAEDFLTGAIEIQPGQYVRVFASWFDFDDGLQQLTEKQKQMIRDTIDDDEQFSGEQELINTYGHFDDNGVQHLGKTITKFDVWEQLAWRRYSIREECKRDVTNFNRDFPHSWQTAFTHSGNPRFNQTGLAVLKKRLGQRVPMHGIMEDAHGRIAYRATGESEATVTLFERPYPGMKYLLGCDPMTGISQTGGKDPDYHSAFVLRAGYWDNMGKWNRPATVARVVQCRWDLDVLELNVWRLARYFGPTNGCKVVVEMNMDRGITELLRQRGADLYQREIFNQREQKYAPALGIQTNQKTREVIVEGLATAIREWDTPGDGLDIFCPIALGQFDNFVRKENGRSEHADGHHDDDVLSIGIAFQVIEHATTYHPPRFTQEIPPDLRERGTQSSSPSAYS